MGLGKDLINKPIFTLDEGRFIGKVQDLYLSDELDSLLGLSLGAQGLIRRKTELIRREDVTLFGVDIILVSNADVITDDKTFPAAKGWMRREKLIGRDVDTPGGTRLGVIGDVVVDASGVITGFALQRVYVEGPLADKRYVDRQAAVDFGNEDGRMTIDLPKLEAILSDTAIAPLPLPETLERPETITIAVDETAEGEAAESLPPAD